MEKPLECLEKKKKKKRIAFIAFICVLPILLTIAFVSAYFSDTLEKSGQIKTGTLQLSGNYAISVNGVASDANVSNFNPGDVIVIQGTITNIGNKSAWIRQIIDLDFATEEDSDLLNHLTFFDGVYDLEQIMTEEVFELDFIDGTTTAKSQALIINGNEALEDSETETGEDDIYLDSDSYQFAITVYFHIEAGNDAQGKTFGFNVVTQALQYRNNTQTPSEQAWQAVTAVNVKA